MTIKIEKGVSMETARKQRRFPWAQMQVGDSFLVESVADRNSATNSSYMSAREIPGLKIRTAKENGKYRIWRIA